MKLIIRADDVGYTVTHNDGTMKTIEEGITTSADLMLDCPGTEDACIRLRQFPWISIGWHTHFWGSPVLPVSEVPSMVDENGRFRWRKNKELVKEVVFEEALKECRAELQRCERLLGRVPDTWAMHGIPSPLEDAVRTACDEYGIVYDYFGGKGYDGKEKYCDPRYRNLKIEEYIVKGSPHIKSMKLEDFPAYHPADAIMEIPVEDKTYIFSRHPGFLDDYVLGESSCTLQRVKDVEALCDDRVKEWIQKNKIELVNQRDALYGLREYQNQLKAMWEAPF